MAKYKATGFYGNSVFWVNEGDVVELDAAEAERLERDSPGTFVKVEDDTDDATVAAGLMSEHGAAIKEELETQIPTLDLDPEDKAKEIPGEGNKYTPASGYNPDPGGVRVVERAKNRMETGAAKRGADEVVPADLSAQARVTDVTPASAAADEKQLKGGATASTTTTEPPKASKKG